jgi:aminoacrylate hydrolase
MAVIEANGIEQFYEWHGSSTGTPVALVAGMGGASSYWAPQIADFSARHRTLVYDQRGTGLTARVTVQSIRQLADDFVALLDALHIEKLHFVGHSTGGAIGQVVAVYYPERIASLVLYASIHRADPYRHRVWGLRKRILEQMGPEVYAQTTSLFFYPPEFINANHDALLAVEAKTAATELSAPDIMGSRIGAILEFDISAKLGQVRSPALVICAEDDLLTPAYFSRDIAAAIPGAELKLFEHGGHAISRSRSAEFNELVLRFLDR